METVAKDELTTGETYTINLRKNKLQLEGDFTRLETVLQGGQPVEYVVFTNVILKGTYNPAMCRLAQVKKLSGNISAADCNDYNNKENEFYLRAKQWNFISKDRKLAKKQAYSELETKLGPDLKDIIKTYGKGGKTRRRSSKKGGKTKRRKIVKKTRRRKTN